jgi:hypothetical protein
MMRDLCSRRGRYHALSKDGKRTHNLKEFYVFAQAFLQVVDSYRITSQDVDLEFSYLLLMKRSKRIQASQWPIRWYRQVRIISN